MICHITLRADALKDPAARSRALESIIGLGARNVNEKRFARSGIITAELDEQSMEQISELAEVAEIRPDGAFTTAAREVA